MLLAFALAALSAPAAPAAAPACTITGTPGRDVLAGRNGADVICGRGGDDVIEGGRGNDRLLGGTGADLLVGGAGLDILVGERGRDTLKGGDGADLLVAVDGVRDTVLGGRGPDRARLDGRDRRLSVEKVFGRDGALLAAGDIADCHRAGRDFADETASLLDQNPGARVAALGDNAYPASEADLGIFTSCYASTWGRAKARTRPAIGNHEYDIPAAAAYFDYFGAAAGARGKGWYSYDLASWHIVVLNGECANVGCAAGSEQERWLRADLARSATSCTLAYWHTPRFSSGKNGTLDPVPSAALGDVWRALYAAGVDVVLNGHDHDYERFAPQTPEGLRDDARGIREFVVGTGGSGLSDFLAVLPTSEVRESQTYGVLRLTLRVGGYAWRFLPIAGASFADSGSSLCH